MGRIYRERGDKKKIARKGNKNVGRIYEGRTGHGGRKREDSEHLEEEEEEIKG